LISTTGIDSSYGCNDNPTISIIVKDIDTVSNWYMKMLGFEVHKQMELPQHDSLKIYFLKWKLHSKLLENKSLNQKYYKE